MWFFRVIVVFCFKMTELLITSTVRSGRRRRRMRSWTPPPNLTPEEKVYYLVRTCYTSEYDPGWIYHRSRELGLEETYCWLQRYGRISEYYRSLGGR